MDKKTNILIIGKLPPPIGGVTIHTARLLEQIKNSNKFNCEFKENALSNLLTLFLEIHKFDLVHVHSSSPIVRFYYMFICMVFRKRGVVTIHGDIGRFKSRFKNYMDMLTIKIAGIPILLNQKSFVTAKKWNSNSRMISSFIPPISENEILSNELQIKINKLKSTTKLLCCTNAYRMTFDKNDNEIYGIREIIEYFNKNTEFGLILSDPSGEYKKYFSENNMILSDNILHISVGHSYFKILEHSDLSIRNTTTDGDSLSIKESLYLDKITLVTDVVSRPSGCVIYKRTELEKALNRVLKEGDYKKKVPISVENAYEELEKIYKLGH